MIPTFIKFRDLKARGIATSWTTLNNWIAHDGFPPGRLFGPTIRVWSEDEVAEWLASRSTTARAPRRGASRKYVARKPRRREGVAT
jgi:predicted DNA-binding transcriptional regulator AlpA